ncbi:deoxyribonuclease IV [Radiobacillus kanasensis]|uniref:deoxyribonuclease IV n=1 Tax=Radiobacillus kanasensis TaxID=2844358 RepID=UPI001E386E9E|nr:deoxyribonuclease IV [Radiobacillus kanasensis]UFU01208.1 deoxyribonuclease IV [Radiobacillus kanasensis]
MKLGCHVSIRQGYLGAAQVARGIQATAFQYFPKNPRGLSVKSFSRDDALSCKEYCEEHRLVSISHSPYPTDLTAVGDKQKKVVESLRNDLEISNACGSVGVVVHFGKNERGKNPLETYQQIIDTLNQTLADWDEPCKILIENNASKLGTMGTTLEELVQIRRLSEFPESIGFCLDTCHAFASGLWTGDNWKELIKKGEELGYLDQLSAIHFNNSMYETGSGKDRHANILNHGHIKAEQFEDLFHTDWSNEFPFIMETPDEFGVTHEQEIKQVKDWLPL